MSAPWKRPQLFNEFGIPMSAGNDDIFTRDLGRDRFSADFFASRFPFIIDWKASEHSFHRADLSITS
jgi:hypothetical protein